MVNSKVQGPNALQRADGSYTEDEEQHALLLLEAHFINSRLDDQLDYNLEFCTPRKDKWEVAKAVIIPQRLNWAIDS